MTSSSMANLVLVDANVIVAAVLPSDPHHGTSTRVISDYVQKGTEFITNNYIQSEAFTITLLRSKSMQAVEVLEEQFFTSGALKVFPIPAAWQQEITTLFRAQQKYRGEFLSFADASLIVQARKQRISTILTFDTTFEQFKHEFDLPCVSK